MTEAYYGGETAEPAGGGADAGAATPDYAGTGPESADSSGSYPDTGFDDDYAGYSDADIEAFLAAEEQLPESRTRQEAAADARNGNSDNTADSDLADEYDGDVAAFLAAEDQLPESRTRQEAAAAAKDGTTQAGDDPDSFSGDPASEYDGDVAAFLAAEEQLPEPRTRQEAAATWGDGPGYDEAGLAAEYDGDLGALTTEDLSRGAAEDCAPGNPPREAGARAGSGDGVAEGLDQGGADSVAQSHVTHYQANVRGEQLDLWTDGQGHWASEYKRADDALPVDHLADVRSRMGTEVMAATEWADGREITVTRDPKDGVWIPGLPGEVPDEAGDVLADPDASQEQRSRSRDILAETNRESENLLDAIKENSNLTYEAMQHPPEGKAEVPVPAHGPVLETTPHETEIGGMVSGAFALGIGLWMLGEKLREQFTRGKAGAGHASDG